MTAAQGAGERAAASIAAILIGALFAGIVLAAALIAITGRPFAFEANGLSLALASAWLLLAAGLWRLGPGPPSWRTFAWWAALAALLRVTAFLALGGLEGLTMRNDYEAYLTIARKLLDGEGFLAHTRSFGWVRGLYPPLYPLLLAGAGSVLGVSAGTACLLNIGIDICSAALLWRIGRRLGDARAGMAAAALFLTWPSFVLMAALPQKEGLVMLLALVLAFLALRVDEEGPAWRLAAAFGSAAAFACLAQPALAPFILCLGLVLLLRWRAGKLLLLALRAAPFFLLVMLPWWVRNWLAFGQFVPFTTAMGPSMAYAAAGRIAPWGPDMLALAEPDRSAADAGRALDLMAAHPVAFLRRSLNGVAHAMLIEQYDAIRVSRFDPPFRWATALLPVMAFSYAAAAGLAFRTAWRGRGAEIGFAALILLACLAEIGLFGPWFEFGQRHRLFMMPFLILLAGFSLKGSQAASPQSSAMRAT